MCFQENLTIEDLIILSGGIADGRILEFVVEIARQDSTSIYGSDLMQINLVNTYSTFFDENNFSGKLDENSKKYETLLKPNDFVSLRTKNINMNDRFVEIFGAVMYPGVYSIENKGEKLSSIMERAGGLLYNANQKQLFF